MGIHGWQHRAPQQEGTPNANNFIVGATGTLTFTEGTGRFRNASGSAHFIADFGTIYPASSFLGGTTAPAQVMAVYSVEGTRMVKKLKYIEKAWFPVS
jgi:hypothetical protein